MPRQARHGEGRPVAALPLQNGMFLTIDAFARMAWHTRLAYPPTKTVYSSMHGCEHSCGTNMMLMPS